MAGFRSSYRRRFRLRPINSTTVMVVCLVLMALLAVVQVAHFHSNANDADHCALCIAMHSAAPVGVAAVIIVLVQVGVPAPVYQARALVRYWHPKLFTRPPPTDL